MPKFDKKWHEQDFADELQEYEEANTILEKWSELSDLVYTSSRGKWSGHNVPFPKNKFMYIIGLIYMYPKYTSRWLFFRKAGQKIGAKKEVHAVRNPKKAAKLKNVATENGIKNINEFQKICEKQLKHWILLP
ncbi:hypothetical protein LJC64_02205 [Ruminococcaceae bacterium OttesenSCG-928-A11]|nr:hypothetical protein [Ruminococcaceae bacterium OttesenSCG-928-A11]